MFINLKDYNYPEIYDGTLLLKKFSYVFMKNTVKRTGNIISFNSPIDFRSELSINYNFPDMVNFCVEIPDISTYAGVCFMKLFLINLADYFSNRLGKNIQIENSNLIILDEFNAGGLILNSGLLNIVQWNRVDDTFMFYVGLFNKLDHKSYNILNNAYGLNLSKEQVSSLIRDIELIFYNLSLNIYIESSK